MPTYECFEKLPCNRTFESEEDRVAWVRHMIQTSSVVAAAATLQPFFFVDTALVTPIQMGLVYEIGRTHGYTLDRTTVFEMLGTFGTSLLGRNAAMAAAKVVPVLGHVATASIAFATTWAIGEVSHIYFLSGRTISREDLQARYHEVLSTKAQESRDRHSFGCDAILAKSRWWKRAASEPDHSGDKEESNTLETSDEPLQATTQKLALDGAP